MEPRRYNHLNISTTEYKTIKLRTQLSQKKKYKEKFGQLVLLGFDVTTFTPAAYQRRSLQRPSKEI